MIKAYLRKQIIYSVWANWRGRQQAGNFNGLLDKYLAKSINNETYRLSVVMDRLKNKGSARRLFFDSLGVPSVVIFGAEDWEQDGLWPSFNRVVNCHFWNYADEIRRHSPGIKSGTAEMRAVLAERFLAYLDLVDTSVMVRCVFMYAAGHHIDSILLDELHSRGIWTIIMSLDDKQQFSMISEIKDEEPHQIRVARKCDLYWTTWKTGTQIIIDKGGTPWYAPEAADPAFHRPLDVEKDIDVLFIGQAYGTRAALVRYLCQRGFSIQAFGKGWPGGYVDFDTSVILYNRARIVLGFGSVGFMDGVKHLKGRDFEVPMCGALYLTSYNPELADFFAIGKEILCYSSFEECADMVHWLLRNPDEASNIRTAALARSIKDHTWEKRLVELFQLFPH